MTGFYNIYLSDYITAILVPKYMELQLQINNEYATTFFTIFGLVITMIYDLKI